jgi:hypothetical protein
MRQLPRDYYIHDEKRHLLVGKDTGRTFRMADAVYVRLLEADPQRGSTVFEMVEGADDNETAPRRPRSNDRGRSGRGDSRGKKPFAKKPFDKKRGHGGARSEGAQGHRRDDDRDTTQEHGERSSPRRGGHDERPRSDSRTGAGSDRSPQRDGGTAHSRSDRPRHADGRRTDNDRTSGGQGSKGSSQKGKKRR